VGVRPSKNTHQPPLIEMLNLAVKNDKISNDQMISMELNYEQPQRLSIRFLKIIYAR
jgi:hypothetical protein